MIRTLLAFFTLAFVTGCSSPQAEQAAPPPPEAIPLQGAWKIANIDENGFKLTMVEYDRIRQMTLAFSGMNFAMTGFDRLYSTGTYTLDTAQTPNVITLVNSDPAKTPQQFIYQVNENGTLALCGTVDSSPQLPTEFKSDRTTRTISLTFAKAIAAQ